MCESQAQFPSQSAKSQLEEGLGLALIITQENTRKLPESSSGKGDRSGVTHLATTPRHVKRIPSSFRKLATFMNNVIFYYIFLGSLEK
ncbi:MAG: hypothetical protein CMB99_00165 [Flavobacteriaceae bacterium]|nr:hypothetical protein [Flavobacteriaceae bacterium]